MRPVEDLFGELRVLLRRQAIVETSVSGVEEPSDDSVEEIDDLEQEIHRCLMEIKRCLYPRYECF